LPLLCPSTSIQASCYLHGTSQRLVRDKLLRTQPESGALSSKELSAPVKYC
jgi:hypothetical protein